MSNTLWLAPYTRSKHQLSMSFGVNDLRFSTSYWYKDVDLIALERQFGIDYMEKVYFHIIAFEANKLTSLKPDTFDLGPFKRYHTLAFEELWLTIQKNVWAQWRYENNFPDYAGPRWLSSPTQPTSTNLTVANHHDQVLLFCGGGKDSLVSLQLLENAEIPYSTCAYFNSIYGRTAPQQQLIGSLLHNAAQPQQQHSIWIYEDFLDSPVIELAKEYGITSLTAAETPSSVFASLPIVLQHHYRYISFGHERSADTPNLIWEQTGEPVNHQWGKSSEAEQLLNNYIQNQFIANSHYFSLLKPIYDVVIFNLLRANLDSVPFTHSCNIAKPWCKQCAKCAYVWLNYMAYLPVSLVNQMFEVNLLDLPANQLWFRQMLGLEKHTPFECIGQINESRLAFEVCRRKGLTGKAMTMFIEEVKDFNIYATVDDCLTVNHAYLSMPINIASKIFPQLTAATKASQEYIASFLP